MSSSKHTFVHADRSGLQIDLLQRLKIITMPMLFPEPVNLQGAKPEQSQKTGTGILIWGLLRPDGPLFEQPSVLLAVYAAGKEHEARMKEEVDASK